jgi:hypothetical protein
MKRRRWAKETIYYRLPLFVRSLGYWIWRYVFRLGFLDGGAGFIYHTLHAFWYRFLVDARLFEIAKNKKVRGTSD